MRFVVTGCGRSGTQYVSHLLTAAGLDCGHESVFNAWPAMGLQPDWRQTTLDGDSSYIAAPFAAELAAELAVVHLIRPPLDHIRSVVGIQWLHHHRNPWVQFLNHHCGLLRYPPGPVRAAWYWLEWNRLVEPYAGSTWRLHEIGADDVQQLATVVSTDLDEERLDAALEGTSRSLNHRNRDESIVLDDLGPLRGRVIEQAERYRLPLETEALPWLT